MKKEEIQESIITLEKKSKIVGLDVVISHKDFSEFVRNTTVIEKNKSWGISGKSVVYFIDKNSGYGFTGGTSRFMSGNLWNKKLYRKCSSREVIDLIIYHLDKNGFKNGVKYKGMLHGMISVYNTYNVQVSEDGLVYSKYIEQIINEDGMARLHHPF